MHFSARSTSIRVALLIATVGSLLSVTSTEAHRPAGKVQAGIFVVPDRFRVEVPDEEIWRQSSNSGGRRLTHVVFRERHGSARLSIQVMPESEENSELPIDVLANISFVQLSNRKGGSITVESMNRILLDEREAIAVTGVRFDRPTRWLESLVVLRSQGFIIEIGYSAHEASSARFAPQFERWLRTFKVDLPGEFDPYVLGEIPIGPPGRVPRQLNVPHKPPPIVKPTRENPLY